MLVCSSAELSAASENSRIDPAARTALLQVSSTGVIPSATDENPEGAAERAELALRALLDEELHVFADFAEQVDGRVPVRFAWRRDWREALSEALGVPLAQARLEIALVSEATVPLIERGPAATIRGDDDDQ